MSGGASPTGALLYPRSTSTPSGGSLPATASTARDSSSRRARRRSGSFSIPPVPSSATIHSCDRRSTSAVDRAAIRRASGSELQSALTDQYLPPGFPGFRDAHVYPLTKPDLTRARRLARGNTRSGKAVLFTVDSPPRLAAAQSLRGDLAKIGLDVEIVGIPRPAYFGRLGATGAYDIGFRPWVPDYADPFSVLNVNFDGGFVGSMNWGRFNDRSVNRALREAAVLRGAARLEAYAALDERLARDAAPMIAVEALNDATLVSGRVGCVTQPFELAVVCLRR